MPAEPLLNHAAHEELARAASVSVEPPDYEELLASNAALRALTASLCGVLDSLLLGVWDYDLTTGRAWRSAAHDQIFGYTQALQEWTFDSFLTHVAPDHREDIRARLDRCMTTGTVELDCPIIRVDGSSARICSRGRLVRDAAGQPQRLVGVLMDVTGHDVTLIPARGRRRDESLVSTLTHELRRPLAALMAAVEVTRLTSRGEVAADHVTEIMRRQIDQMNRVVEDVIEVTRWSRGKVAVRKERLDVRDVISNAAEDIRVAAVEAGHELRITPMTEPSWIDADPERLRQALSTLLRNAVKHTDRGGRISLRADRRGSTVVLSVTDTGRGIEPHALSGVFDLRSDPGPTESFGLGLDLNIASEIVALHNGRIEARSEGVGHGSEFRITLPLDRGSLDAPPA